jgi:hypothetical protein
MVQRRDRVEAHGSGPRPRFPVNTPDLTSERLSTDELVELLVRAGARILARQDHGIFLGVRRRLVFLRRVSVIGVVELDDALRAAAIGPGRFDMLLAQLRGERGPHRQASDDPASSQWLLPALSGAEVIAALEHAGFSRTDSCSDRVELSRRRGEIVQVPLVAVLDAEQIGSVLAAARLSVVSLLELLERTSP